jgi:soluble lytic murein transglycosylase-like protein
MRAPVTSRTANFSTTLAQAQSRTAPRALAKPVVNRSSPISPVSAADAGGAIPYWSQITAAARKYGLDPALLAGVVKSESNFNPHAQSGVGAKGLTQLMDATASGLGVSNPFDVQQSLEGGAKFLSGLLKQFNGDQHLALAAYNAGPAAVQKYGGIPPYQETQRYVPKVLANAAQFRRIIGG